MSVVVIPESYMGQTLNESDVKRVLLELDPGFHFDVGGNLDIWHPLQGSRQGVWHLGKHICAMDRATIPEFPIWSMKTEYVQQPTHTLGCGDTLDPFILEEFVEIDGKQQSTGMSARRKKVRDRILLVGWRHTLSRVINKGIPGVTEREIGSRLRVDLTLREHRGAIETDDPNIADQTVTVT